MKGRRPRACASAMARIKVSGGDGENEMLADQTQQPWAMPRRKHDARWSQAGLV